MTDLIFEKLICEKLEKGDYYSIQYLDLNDGNNHIGFSSYSLDIVSEYIKEYFINETTDTERHAHWIELPTYANGIYKVYKCSSCERILIVDIDNGQTLDDYPYCHCGCKMNGGQQSNEKN